MAMQLDQRARELVEMVLAIYARGDSALDAQAADALRLAKRCMEAVEVLVKRGWEVHLPWPVTGDLVFRILENERIQYDDEQAPPPQ